jgi:uncharacterized protein YkwD
MNNPFFISNSKKQNKLKTKALIAVSTLVLSIGLARPAAAEPITHDSIIRLTNQARIERGVTNLSESSLLNAAARAKAQDMLADNYFDHYSPKGATPWNFVLSSGYDYSLAGENLAMDFNTVEGTTTAWLNSPSHARNLLSPDFTDIGVAVVNGNLEGHSTTLVVQMFGRPQESLLSMIDKPISQTVNSILGLQL